MFQQLAKLVTFGRDPRPASARSFSPLLVWEQPTSRLRPRRPRLECIWLTDRRTGNLQCRWVSRRSSGPVAIEPDPNRLPPAHSNKHLHAA
jgi:hypothetical protein